MAKPIAIIVAIKKAVKVILSVFNVANNNSDKFCDKEEHNIRWSWQNISLY